MSPISKRLLASLALLAIPLLLLLFAGPFGASPSAPPPHGSGVTPGEGFAGELPASGPAHDSPPRGGIRGTVRRGLRAVESRVELLPFEPTGWPVGAAAAPLLGPAPSDPSSPPLGRVETRPDGAFEFAGLAVGSYLLCASVGDGATGVARADITADGERVRADLSVGTGSHRLAGRIVHADGRPFRGLVGALESPATEPLRRLRASRHWRKQWRIPDDPELSSGPPLLTLPARPDAEGRFEIRGLPPGPVDLIAFGDGFRRSAARWVPVPSGGELQLMLDDSGAELTGRVVALEDGSAVAGAEVLVVGSDRQGALAAVSSRTDREGDFAVSVPGDRRELSVAAPGFRPFRLELEDSCTRLVVRLDRRRVRVEPGSTATADLDALPTASIRGRVVDAAGRPCGGALVRAGTLGETDRGPGERARAVADEEGRFNLEDLVPERTLWLEITAADSPTASVGPYRAKPGETLSVSLTMEENRCLDLTVLAEETGSPVSGARVVLLEEPGRPHHARWWFSGPDGGVRIDRLPEYALWLHVDHPEFRPPERALHLPGSKRSSSLTVHLRRGLEVAGRVRAPGLDGPFAGSLFSGYQFRDWGRESEAGERVHPLLPDGTFRVCGLAPGDCFLEARVSVGDRKFRGGEECAAGDRDVVISLEAVPDPDRHPETVVRVVGPGGEAVPRAELRVVRAERERHPDRVASAEVRDGLARVRLDPRRGPFRFHVSRARSALGDPLPLAPAVSDPEMPGPDGITIRLAPGRAVAGRVLGEAGGAIEGASVVARPARRDGGLWRPEHGRATTDEQGRFRIVGLDDDRYSLDVWGVEGWELPDSVEVAAGEEGVVLVLRAEPACKVTVMDEAGEPVPGANVTIERYHGYFNSWSTQIREEFTDPAGVAVLRGYNDEGPYTLRVVPPLSRGDLCPARETDWRPRDRTVTLLPARYVTGAVLDRRGLPALDARLVVRWADGREEAVPYQDGTFRIGPLPDVLLTLAALPEAVSLDNWLGEVYRLPPGRDEVRLVFDPGWDLDLRFTGMDTVGSDDGIWLVEEGSGRALEEGLDEDGRVTFPSLRHGESYTLLARPWESSRCAHVTNIRATGAEIEVALREGMTISGTVRLPAGIRDFAVFARRGAVSFLGMVADDNRSFEIRGLPDGAWTLRVVAWGPTGEVVKEVPVTAGDRVVVEFE